MPQKVEEELEKRLSIKWWPSLKLNFQKAGNNNVKTDPPVVFNSEPFTLLEKARCCHSVNWLIITLFNKLNHFPRMVLDGLWMS